MDIRFDAILCSKFGNEKSDAAHIKCSRGPQVRRRLRECELILTCWCFRHVRIVICFA